MKYKMVFVNYTSGYELFILDNRYRRTNDLPKIIGLGDWLDLGLLGIHIFEGDDSETLDLMKVQKERNSKEYHDKMFDKIAQIQNDNDTVNYNIKRKSEIRRIAEQLYVHEQSCYSSAIRNAREFVDNFDAKFEKMDQEK